MSTIAADPLALMPRADVAQAATAAPATPGAGADFALALADLISAEAVPVVAPDSLAEAPAVLADGAAGSEGPLPLLEGLGRIAVPVVAALADTPAEGVAQAMLPADVVLPMDGEALPTAVVDEVAAVPDGSPVPADEATGDVPQVQVVPVAAHEAPVVDAGTEPAVVAPIPADVPEVVDASDDAPVEEVPADDLPADDLPAEELVEAMSIAVAAIVAAPVAAPQTPAKAEVPQGDAGAESVRMAGAAALLAPAAKPRDAKAAQADAQPKEAAAPDDAASEEVEAAPVARDKAERPAAKPVVRPTHASGEQTAQPQADRRAPEPAVVRTEAARAPDPAAASAPLPAATTAQGAAVPSGPVALDRPGWEGVVTERIVAELSLDGQQIDLELTPENLGGLKIRLEISDGQAQVRFVTETPEAARLIQQNEHRLSESLSRAGLSLGGHDSASRDPQQQQGDRSGRPAPRGAEIAFQRSGEPRMGMIPQRAQVGLVNLMA